MFTDPAKPQQSFAFQVAGTSPLGGDEGLEKGHERLLCISAGMSRAMASLSLVHLLGFYVIAIKMRSLPGAPKTIKNLVFGT